MIRSARRPTILMWFVFVVLFALPFTLEMVRHCQAYTQFVLLTSSSFPLIVALLVALFVRRMVSIAVSCFAIRTIWYMSLLFCQVPFAIDDYDWKWRCIFFPLWPEFSCVLDPWKQKGVSLSEWWQLATGVGLLFSSLYALVGVLLAMTCRLRVTSTTSA